MEKLVRLGVEQLVRGRYQPRITNQAFTEESLSDLARSIRTEDIIQPIVVRQINAGAAGNTYEILAGERRWRASQLAGLTTVPCVIREATDEQAAAIALIENIQRESLTAYETVMALQRFVNEFGFTHEKIGESIGWSRVSVSQALRVLNLPATILKRFANNDFSLTHARTLLLLKDPIDQTRLADLIVERSLTVRKAEITANRWMRERDGGGEGGKKFDPDIDRLQRVIATVYGADVELRHSQKGRGYLKLSYRSLDELEGILEKMRIDLDGID